LASLPKSANGGFELTRKTYEQQIIHKPQGSMGLFFSAMVFNEILRKA
jgi:hypothetical protein